MARYLLSLTLHIIVFTDLPHHDPYVAAILFDLKPSASLHVGRKRNSHTMAALVGSGMHPAVASIVGSFSPSIGAANVQPIPFDTPQMREARHMAVLTGMKRFDPSPVCASSHTSFCQAELPEWDEHDVDFSIVPSTAWLCDVQPPSRTAKGDLARFPWLQQHTGQVWSTKSARTEHPLDRIVNLGLDKAAIDGQRGRTHTGVKAWHAFARDEMKTTPCRPMEASAPLWARLSEEWMAMRFVCALVEVRGISVASAGNYWGAVQGWHARTFGIKIGGGIQFHRLPQMLKGLKRVYGDAPPRVRRGIAPNALRKAMDLCLDPADPDHANVRAAVATAFQGLLRSAEFAHDPKRKWSSQRGLTRADVVELTSERMTLMMSPRKSEKHLHGKSCALVIGAGGEFIDAVAEVRNLLRVDPLKPGQKACDTPLFRRAGSMEPIRTSDVLDLTRMLMRSIGEDPSQFGTHSYRIGGATALFAAGADSTVIRTMGRWSSDIHQLYVRACFERCCDWSRRAGSTKFTDVAHVFDEVDDY